MGDDEWDGSEKHRVIPFCKLVGRRVVMGGAMGRNRVGSRLSKEGDNVLPVFLSYSHSVESIPYTQLGEKQQQKRRRKGKRIRAGVDGGNCKGRRGNFSNQYHLAKVLLLKREEPGRRDLISSAKDEHPRLQETGDARERGESVLGVKPGQKNEVTNGILQITHLLEQPF